MKDKKIIKTEEDWKKKLTPEQYDVLRSKGTEAPFSGKYFNEKRKGMYNCAACGNKLFSSNMKFDSSMPGLEGWPSFDQAEPGAVEFVADDSYGMHRTEVLCAKCGSHLGHIFEDSSAKTGKHYCINSICLDMKKEKGNSEK